MRSPRFKFKQTAFALICVLMSGNAFVSIPAQAAHPLQGELESMFGAMSNFTSPGAFESARRGVISGGGLTIRNRTYDIQLMTVVPPSMKGGCGGIDIFLGSFSYISLDQFLNFLRAIASQAAGYAFEMALTTGCPLCAQILESMRKAAQMMNNLNMNSCQLAQGIFTGKTADAIKNKATETAKVGSVLGGIVSDVVESFTDSKTPEAQIESSSTPEAKRAKEQIAPGNIIWQGLTKSSVNTWFGLSNNDTSMKEALMSMTGTIVSEFADGPDGGRTVIKSKWHGGLIKLEDLVLGTERTTGDNSSNRQIYSCEHDKNECLTQQMKPIEDFKGLAKIIYDELTKGDGIIAKFSNPNPGIEFTEQQKSIIAGLPGGLGSVLRNLSIASPQSARTLADQISKVTAVSMAYSLADELLVAAESAMEVLQSQPRMEVQELFEASRERLYQEQMILQTRFGTPVEVLAAAEYYLAYADIPDPVSPSSNTSHSSATAK